MPQTKHRFGLFVAHIGAFRRPFHEYTEDSVALPATPWGMTIPEVMLHGVLQIQDRPKQANQRLSGS